MFWYEPLSSVCGHTGAQRHKHTLTYTGFPLVFVEGKVNIFGCVFLGNKMFGLRVCNTAGFTLQSAVH